MASRLLVIAASLTLLMAGLAVWTAREALDTERWVATSGALARDPAIREATAEYVAGELPDVPGANAALRRAAILEVLGSPAFERLWRVANREAHRDLVAAIDDRAGPPRPVVLDLGPLLRRVAARWGLESELVAHLSPASGRVTVVRADELDRARDGARLLRGAAWMLGMLAIALLLASVAAARDGRARALARAGVAVLAAGLGLLLVRSVGGDYVVDELTRREPAHTPAVDAAADAAWRVGTTSLAHLAWGLAATGAAVAVMAGALALARGPRTARSPRTARR